MTQPKFDLSSIVCDHFKRRHNDPITRALVFLEGTIFVIVIIFLDFHPPLFFILVLYRDVLRCSSKEQSVQCFCVKDLSGAFTCPNRLEAGQLDKMIHLLFLGFVTSASVWKPSYGHFLLILPGHGMLLMGTNLQVKVIISQCVPAAFAALRK